MADPEKRYVFDKPGNVRRAIHTLYTVCIIALAADVVVHRHVEHPWEHLFGFYAFYGFIACTALVVIAKGLRRILMRREDYYD
jgi:hypothetical protein